MPTEIFNDVIDNIAKYRNTLRADRFVVIPFDGSLHRIEINTCGNNVNFSEQKIFVFIVNMFCRLG